MDSTAKENQTNQNGQQSGDSIPDVEFLEAFEMTREALDAIPAEKLKHIRLNPGEAMARGMRVAENAQRDRVAFEAMYVNPPLEEIDWLRTRAMAVKGAELSAKILEKDDAVKAPDFTAARAERHEHITKLRAVLLGDREVGDRLDKILENRGHQDLGNDLAAIAALEREYWPAIRATGLISEKAVEHAAETGVQILRWEEHKDRETDGRDYIRRAMVLLEEAYSQVRDYAFPLYRENPGKWREDYPSLYARTGTTRSSRPTTDEKDEKDEERRDTTEATPTTPEPTGAEPIPAPPVA